MLRAVRLAAKLGLAIDKKTAEPIPRARAADRATCRRRGCSTRCRSCCSPGTPTETLRSLRAHGLSHGLLPLLDVILEQPLGQQVHRRGAREHRRARARGQGRVAGVPVRDAAVARGAGDSGTPRRGAARSRCPRCSTRWTACSTAQAQRIAIPRRFEATIKEIWSLQPRFEQRAGARPFRLLEHPRFRAAYDFLALRGGSGEVPQALVDWWTRFQDARPGRARRDAAPGRGAEEAPPLARPRPQARDDGCAASDARRRRRRPHDDGRRSDRVTR